MIQNRINSNKTTDRQNHSQTSIKQRLKYIWKIATEK